MPRVFKLRILPVALLLALLAPSAWLAWRYRDMPHFGAYHDDAVYFIGAKSIAEGYGYRILHLPEQPAQTKYPPLYPLLLSLVWRIEPGFPANLPWLTLMQWLFLPAYLILAWRWFRSCEFSRPVAWILTAVLALSPMTLLLTLTPMTELPFSVALLGVMLMVSDRKEVGARTAFLAGLLAAVAFLMRSNGVVLLVSVPAILFWRGRRREAGLFALPLLVAFAGWQLWCRASAGPVLDVVGAYYVSYVEHFRIAFSFSELPVRIWMNADMLLTGLTRLVVFFLGDHLWYHQLAWLVGAVGIAGVYKMFRGGVKQYPAFALLFCGLLIAWIYPPDARFVFPVLPLFVAGIWTKLAELAAMVRKTLQSGSTGNKAAAVFMACLMAALALGTAGSFAWGNARLMPAYLRQHGEDLKLMLPIYAWIRETLPSDAAIAAYEDTLVFLHTGRRACTVPPLPQRFYSPRKDDMSRYIAGLPEVWRRRGIRHVLVTDNDFNRELHAAGRKAMADLTKDETRFEVLMSAPAARALQIRF